MNRDRGAGTATLAGATTAPAPRFAPARWAAHRGIHYGWVIVAVTFLMLLTSAGVRAAASVLIRPLEADFGWSRGEISLALSLSLFMYGLAGPISGRISERFGLRTMALLFLVVSAAGVALAALVDSLWQLNLFWGVLVGLGTGGVATVMSATVANTWFEERRGLVTGILGGASSAGQLLFLPLLVWVNARWGWRTDLALLSLILAGVIFPLTLALLRSHPAEVGLTPYGMGVGGAAGAPVDTRRTTMREAMRTGTFWLLSGSFFICGFTSMGLIGSHFIPHAVEHGFTEAQAAGVLSVLGAMNVVGTVGSGWLCDRFSPRKLLASYYFLRGLSLLALPAISTLPLMSVFAIVFGLDYIATVPPTVLLTANRFGRRSVASIFGWITFAHMLGGAISTQLAGVIHDIAGEYTIAIYLSAVLGLVAAGLAFGIRPRPQPRPALAGA